MSVKYEQIGDAGADAQAAVMIARPHLVALLPLLGAASPAPDIALRLPVSPACLSSPFGPRVLPGKPKAGTFHWGIDLAAPAGTAVRAAAAGRVVAIHRRGAGGLQVAVQHEGFATLYAHLGRVSPGLAEGKTIVRDGEVLGVIGRTGLSYGAHLYFELRRGGERIDPTPWLAVARCESARR